MFAFLGEQTWTGFGYNGKKKCCQSKTDSVKVPINNLSHSWVLPKGNASGLLEEFT